MSKYISKYITHEQFEFYRLTGTLYEGFVIGVGYVSIKNSILVPTHLNGSNSYWPDRPTDYTHNIIMDNMELDESSEAIIRSLRLTPDKILYLLRRAQNQEQIINMGHGEILVIPHDANEKFNVVIMDDGVSLRLKVSLNVMYSNGDTIYKNTDCLLKDIPLVFGIAPSQLYFDQTNLPLREDDDSVGQPGTWESMIPIWGSGRSAVDHFQKGNYWRGVGYSLLAVSDIFLVKSIVTGIAKGGIKMLGKSYSSWSSYRRLYGKQGFAEPNQHLHHWLWKRNGASSGEGFGWWAKNQMWNLKPVPKMQGMSYDAVHKAIEGKGLSDWSMMRRLYYGTPSWPWSFSVSSSGRLIDINNE